jgi:hypothetical protein
MNRLRKMAIDEFLVRADVAIHNALNDPEILAALTPFGYDETALQAGADLLAEAETLHRAQQAEYAEQYTATAALERAWDAARDLYMQHLALARVAFRDDRETYRFLGLDGRRKRSFAGWVEQAETFYTHLLETPDVLAAFRDRFPLEPSVFADGLAQVEALMEYNRVQEQKKSAAQQATKDRDAAFNALDAWLRDYRAVAKIALRDQLQMLEALQFKAKTV